MLQKRKQEAKQEGAEVNDKMLIREKSMCVVTSATRCSQWAEYVNPSSFLSWSHHATQFFPEFPMIRSQ